MSTSSHFQSAVLYLSSSAAPPTPNQIKLHLYALYKIATTSSPIPTTSRPGLFDLTGRAKWDSWSTLGKQGEWNQERAEAEYVKMAKSLGWSEETKPAPMGGGEDTPRKASEADMKVVSSMAKEEAEDPETASKSHTYAIDGNVDGIKELLRSGGAGTGIDAKDVYGYTLLMLAADRGHIDVVKLLLSLGADRTIQDEEGCTALDMAKDAGNEDVASCLAHP